MNQTVVARACPQVPLANGDLESSHSARTNRTLAEGALPREQHDAQLQRAAATDGLFRLPEHARDGERRRVVQADRRGRGGPRRRERRRRRRRRERRGRGRRARRRVLREHGVDAPLLLLLLLLLLLCEQLLAARLESAEVEEHVPTGPLRN